GRRQLDGRPVVGGEPGRRPPQSRRESARYAGLCSGKVRSVSTHLLACAARADSEGGAAMTWSIIARDEATGRVGIAVASRFFAVGAVVPHIRTGVGAIATQAFINPFYGPQGLALLQAGASAEDTVKFLTGGDLGRDHRQVHVMDRDGR